MYPLASNVLRKPPDGKDEASGSPTIKFLAENANIAFSPSMSKKESCFSAVEPVKG